MYWWLEAANMFYWSIRRFQMLVENSEDLAVKSFKMTGTFNEPLEILLKQKQKNADMMLARVRYARSYLNAIASLCVQDEIKQEKT